MRRTAARLLLGACVCWGVAVGPARPEVSVSFDVATLNELLPALTAAAIVVPLSEEQSIEVFVEDVTVTGFDPTAGAGGQILASLRLRVPQFGVNVPVDSRLSLEVVDPSGSSELVLRFDRAELPLPLAGRVDVARFLPPLRFPAQNLFRVEGARGEVQVQSSLSRVELGQKLLRLSFDLATLPGQ
jgi:hypothetical protein